MNTTSSTHTAGLICEEATFIGIDFHKRYSVFHAIDAAGRDLGKGRIEHHSPQAPLPPWSNAGPTRAWFLRLR